MATQTGSLDLRAVKQTYIKTVAKAQPIYKRTNSNSAPTAPTSKITASTDQTTTGNWTTMHMSRIYASNTAYKYLWTCNQFLAPDGTFLGCSEVVADEGTTVIDGANIVTGSVTAEKIQGETLTLNKFTSSAQSEILNSNIQIGGRNIARDTVPSVDNGLWYRHSDVTLTTEDGFPCFKVEGELTKTLTMNPAYTMLNNDVSDKHKIKPYSGLTITMSADVKFVDVVRGTTNSFISLYGSGATIDSTWRSPSCVNDGEHWLNNTSSNGLSPDVLNGKGWTRVWLRYTYGDYEWPAINPVIYNRDFTGTVYWKNIKVEIGSTPTAWTPAPEDVQAEIDAKKSTHTLNTSYSYTYANILTYSAEGYSGVWNVSSTSGVKDGDTVRLKVTVSDMSNAPVYVVGTVTAVNTSTQLRMTSHGLDTTIIDGGNILTNSIGANQIKANAITIGHVATDTQATILNENVESYDIEPSYPYVEMDTNGSDPTSITVSAKYTKGSNAPTAYSGRFKIETSEDNTNWTTTYTSSANESSTTITTPTAVEDKEPYVYRASPAGGLVDERAIVGGTIAWNQQRLDSSATDTKDGITTSYSNGKFTITNNSRTTNYSSGSGRTAIGRVTDKHKYIVTANSNKDITGVAVQYTNSSNAYAIANVNTVFSVNGISSTNPQFYLRITSKYDFTSTHPINDVVELTLNIFDLTQMFGSTIADYIYSLEQSEAGAGVAWFRKLFPNAYYEYNAGELLSVSAVEKRTTGKNILDVAGRTVTDAYGYTYIYRESNNLVKDGDTLTLTSTGAWSKARFLLDTSKLVDGQLLTISATFSNPSGDNCGVGFRVNGSYITSQFYTDTSLTLQKSITYSAGDEIVAVVINNNTSTSTGHTVVVSNIQIELGSTATAYEPYKRNTYPLSDITLRGIPKLDGSNLYYDGDTYEPSGKVTRKYGIVDLGTLTWYGYGGSYPNLFYTGNLEGVALPQGYLVCSANYDISKNGSSVGDSTHQHHIGFNMNARLYINDTAYTSGTAFKSAMSGVMLVYELATPTTETTTPYSQTQIAGSTEEFVTNNDVPVGHNSSYSSAIKAIRASLYKAGGTTTLLTQTVIPCRTGSTGLAGTAIETANESAKTATSYITAIDESGIKVHAADNVNSNYAKIDADGMEVYKGGNSVAKYSDSSRVGQQSTRHIEIKDGGLQVYQDASTVMAHIGYGSGNATSGTATTPYYVLGMLNGSPTLGNYSLTEGFYNVASGAYSHAEGAWTIASRAYSHSEGYDTEANGNGSHASGFGTIAQGAGQMAIGHYNIANGTYNQFNSSSQILIVGNGTGDDARSNAMVVDASGNVDISGSYKVNGTAIDAYVKTTFTPTSGSSYSNYGGCYYEKYGRLVHVHVGVSGLTTSTSTNIFTLPTGYRPSSPIYAHGTGGAWNNIGYLEISTAGVVNVRSQGTYCGADAFFIV